jgi:inosine-uridine nucleoside N-ribohydrolase
VTRIILDCDPGHDDAIALLLALASPELELVGVTTVAGNAPLERTTANAIRVLDHASRDDIPVAGGADRPLAAAARTAPEVHGESGLDGPGPPPPSRSPEPRHAVDWMAATLEEAPEPITLVPTGPLTNVALLLAHRPELASRIERIVLMGGAIGLGNTTPAAEFNIWVDPEAARRVFGSGIELVMVGLDVTHLALMRAEHAGALAQAGPTGRLVAELHTFYARHHHRRYGWDGAPIHDAVAVAHVIDPTLLRTVHCPVTIETGDGLSRGRTHVDRWRVTDWPPNCHVAVGIDSERFLQLLLSRLST